MFASLKCSVHFARGIRIADVDALQGGHRDSSAGGAERRWASSERSVAESGSRHGGRESAGSTRAQSRTRTRRVRTELLHCARAHVGKRLEAAPREQTLAALGDAKQRELRLLIELGCLRPDALRDVIERHFLRTRTSSRYTLYVTMCPIDSKELVCMS